MIIESDKYNVDHVLEKHVEMLKKQRKFRAKVLYTLNCINNCLSPEKGKKYALNIQYLSRQSNIFKQVATLYCDTAVLQPISFLFTKFEDLPNKVVTGQLLDILYQKQVKGDVSQGFIYNICRMLTLLRHEYQKIKQICMKILHYPKLTEKSILQLFKTITFSCSLSKQQCYELSKFSCIPSITILQFLWLNCIHTKNEKQENTVNNSESLQYKIINGYLEKQWINQRVKYLSMRISLWNATNYKGSVSQLIPTFIDKHYRKSIKPFWEGCFKKVISQIGSIFQHIANEYIYINQDYFKQQLKNLSVQLSKHPQYLQIITDIQKHKQIQPSIQLKFINILPIQFLTKPQIIQKKLILQPTTSNAFKTIAKLKQIQRDTDKKKIINIYLILLEIYLINKQCQYLKNTSKIVQQKLENYSTYIIQLLTKNQQYSLFVGSAQKIIQKCSEKQSQAIFDKAINYLGKTNVVVQSKFHIGSCFIKLKYKKGVRSFINFLSTALQKSNIVYNQLDYYAHEQNYFTKQQLQWVVDNFKKQTQTLLQKIFSKLVDHNFKPCKLVVFSLQKFQIFQQWNNIYRWTLNALDQPNFDNSDGVADSFEVFSCVTKNCKQIPLQIIKKYFTIVSKHWQNYNHHHMVIAQKTCQFLFSDQNLPPTQLQQITLYIKQLIDKPLKTSAIHDIYKNSMQLLLNNILKTQTQKLSQKLIKMAGQQICKIQENEQINYQMLRTKLFAQQIIMWQYQKTDKQIDIEVTQKLIKIINSQANYNITNTTDLQLLIQNSLQIISTIAHQGNLLDLSLINILRNYPNNKYIISFITQIIYLIKQVNLSQLNKFQLHQIIPQLFSTLILSTDSDLNLNYIQFITQLCCDQQSPYNQIYNQNIIIFSQILSSQSLFLVGKYSCDVLNFIFGQQNDKDNENNNKKWMQNIIAKYNQNQTAQQQCQPIEKHVQIKKHPLQDQEQNINEKQNTQNNNQQKNNAWNTQQRSFLITEKEESNSELPSEQQHSQQQKQINKNHQEFNNVEPDKPKDKIKKQIISQDFENNKQKQYVQTDQKKDNARKEVKYDETNKYMDKTKKQIVQSQQSFQSDKQKDKPKKEIQSQHSETDNQEDIPKKQILQQNIKNNNQKQQIQPDKQQPKIKKQVLSQQQQRDNLNKIKTHLNYLTSISNTKIDKTNQQKLQQSLTYLSDVVSIHPYFCKKIIDLQSISKCLQLHSQTQKCVELKILTFFLNITQHQQKNSKIFCKHNSIKFFKKIIKQSLNLHKQLPANQIIIKIVQNCWDSSFQFYSQGLLTVFFQMIQQNINRQQILSLLANNPLSFQIVNQISEQGLLNTAQVVFKIKVSQLTQKDMAQIVLWTRLMGKLCVNQSVKQKLFDTNFHKLTYQKIEVYEQLNQLNTLSYFYSKLIIQLQKFAKWCHQQKIPQYFLKHLQKKKINNLLQIYEYFINFCIIDKIYLDYLFQIGYHLYMIEILQKQQLIPQSETFKLFCTSLSTLFENNHYSIFLTKQIIPNLLTHYKKTKNDCSIKCIQKLVQKIKQIKQLQLLQNQNIYQINLVFNNQINDDVSYVYVLQMYIKLFLQFHSFNSSFITNQFISAVIKKGVFSNNIQGKKKVIQFLIQFSSINKISYGDKSCFMIFQSLFTSNQASNQLQLLYKFEQNQLHNNKIPKQLQAMQNQITSINKSKQKQKKIQNTANDPQLKQLIIKKYIDLRTSLENKQNNFNAINKQFQLILAILTLFLQQQNYACFLFQQLQSNLLNNNLIYPFYFQSSTQLIYQIINCKVLQEKLKNSKNLLMDYLYKLTDYLINLPQYNDKLVQQYLKIIESCLKYNIIQRNLIDKLIYQKIQKTSVKTSQFGKKVLQAFNNFQLNCQLTENMKEVMKKGIKVKMYKADNSNSTLLLYFTGDLLEINCVSSMGSPVKKKWKLPISEITKIEIYDDEKIYKQSVFYLAEGFFSNAPKMENCLALLKIQKQSSFYICFQNVLMLKQWKNYFQIVKKNISSPKPIPKNQRLVKKLKV